MLHAIPEPPPLGTQAMMPEVVSTASRDFSSQQVPLLPVNEPPMKPNPNAINYGGGGVMGSPMTWLLIAGAVAVAAMWYVRD